MSKKRHAVILPYSNGWILPFLFIFPQLTITMVFFIWPTLQSVWQSLFQGDAFGIQQHWVGLANYLDIFMHGDYLYALGFTLFYAFLVAVITLGLGLLLALMVNQVLAGKSFYKTCLIWPYAVAPAISAVLFRFLFNPSVGVLSHYLQTLGIDWNYNLDASQAIFLVVLSAVWQQVSYNFIFFLTGLRAIPAQLIEAAAIDGAGAFHRFSSVVFPLLSPTTFFLFVMNLVYAFFDTFGIIHIITQGGPASATSTLVYKAYNDGFFGLDLGGAAAQSVVLMLCVSGLTLVQFRFIEKKVHY